VPIKDNKDKWVQINECEFYQKGEEVSGGEADQTD
tara:strand:+ start:306 stop:410 length:105 start_codon:yes stop_codon:yes gene_type:complete